MYIKTEKIGNRTIVHERSHYELTLATADEDGAYLIALVQIDDNRTPLAPGTNPTTELLHLTGNTPHTKQILDDRIRTVPIQHQARMIETRKKVQLL